MSVACHIKPTHAIDRRYRPTGSTMPLMVSRLILSLKKTANSSSTVWSAGQVSSIKFARHTIGGTERRDDVPLRSFVGERGSVSEL